MFKVVRHLYLLGKKTFSIFVIFQLQAFLPLIMMEADAYQGATKAFAEGHPIGDGAGPLVASPERARCAPREVAMRIMEMSGTECRELLARQGGGRLGCARDNQPYVVPIYFVAEGDNLYCFATLGQKIEWMRLNPLVCLKAVEADRDWDLFWRTKAGKSLRVEERDRVRPV
jgi:hypothetical protein